MTTVGQNHVEPWCNLEAVFLLTMVVGLTIYEAGYVPPRNTKHVILKSLVCVFIATIVWYVIGFAFAFGSQGNAFIGNGNFTNIDFEHTQCTFATSCIVCQLASTLFHGSLTERTQPAAYAVLSLSMSAMIHPISAHWIQDPSGWLYKGSATHDRGSLDMSGAFSVHLVTGALGLSGALMLGPRMGRFSRTADTTRRFDSMKNASVAMAGLLLLWCGWMLWNASNCRSDSLAGRVLNARAFASSLLASSAAALAGLGLSYYRHRRYSLDSMSKALLAGMVSVSASASVIDPHFAIVAGLVGGLLCESSKQLLLHLHIDDPLDIASVHGTAGLWGVLVPGFLASDEYLLAFRRVHLPDMDPEGMTPGGGVLLGNDGWLLCAQILAAVVTLVWGGGIGVLTLLVLRRSNLLRVEMDVEVAGCDLAFHDGVPFIDRPGRAASEGRAHEDGGGREQGARMYVLESQPHASGGHMSGGGPASGGRELSGVSGGVFSQGSQPQTLYSAGALRELPPHPALLS